jgi:hypothetical protein
LKAPELHLRIASQQAAPAHAATTPKSNALTADQLPLLISEDRRRWFVCLVRFSAADVFAVAKQSAHAHRYILI